YSLKFHIIWGGTMSQKEAMLAEAILERMGGAENIATVSHCMTRLRLTVKDQNRVRLDEVKALSGVLGVVESSGQVQIILGPGTVNKVANHFSTLVGKNVDVINDPDS